MGSRVQVNGNSAGDRKECSAGIYGSCGEEMRVFVSGF